MALFLPLLKQIKFRLYYPSCLGHLQCNLSSLSLEVSIQLFFFPLLFSMQLDHIFNKYMYKQDLALNNLLELICHKTKYTKPNLLP